MLKEAGGGFMWATAIPYHRMERGPWLILFAARFIVLSVNESLTRAGCAVLNLAATGPSERGISWILESAEFFFM